MATVLLVLAVVSYAAGQPFKPSADVSGERVGHSQAPAARADDVVRAAKLRPPPVQGPALPAAAASNQVSTPAPEPVAIRIPALGIDQELIELGVVGTDLQVPNDYYDIGWWRDGPSAGENGAAVMVGHVDSETGPAVFYQLSGLRRGHEIVVDGADGSSLTFAVRRVGAFTRAGFPSARVYRTDGAPALHLLTCGGTFDDGEGQYSGNVVVFAELVDRSPAPENRRSKADNRKADESESGGREPAGQEQVQWSRGAGESSEGWSDGAAHPGRTRDEGGDLR